MSHYIVIGDNGDGKGAREFSGKFRGPMALKTAMGAAMQAVLGDRFGAAIEMRVIKRKHGCSAVERFMVRLTDEGMTTTVSRAQDWPSVPIAAPGEAAAPVDEEAGEA
jgi:hypothetical protein